MNYPADKRRFWHNLICENQRNLREIKVLRNLSKQD